MEKMDINELIKMSNKEEEYRYIIGYINSILDLIKADMLKEGKSTRLIEKKNYYKTLKDNYIEKICSLRKIILENTFQRGHVPTDDLSEFDELRLTSFDLSVREKYSKRAIEYIRSHQPNNYDSFKNDIKYNDFIPNKATSSMANIKNSKEKIKKTDRLKVDEQTSKAKIKNLRIKYNLYSNVYIFNYDLVVGDSVEKKSLKYKMSIKKLHNKIKRVELWKKFGYSIDFCEEMDLNLFAGLYHLDKNYGTNLVKDYARGKLNAKIKYDMRRTSKKLGLGDMIVQHIVARNQKKLCNTKVCYSGFMRFIDNSYSKISKKLYEFKHKYFDNPKCNYYQVFKKSLSYSLIAISGAILLIPSMFKTIGSFIGKNSSTNSTEIEENNDSKVYNNIKKKSVDISSMNSEDNLKTIIQNNKITTESSNENLEYASSISAKLKYFEKIFGYDIENLKRNYMNDESNLTEAEAYSLVLNDIKSDMYRKNNDIENKSGKMYNNNNVDIEGNNESKDNIEINNNENIENNEISDTNSECSGYMINDKVDLTGKVLTGDSQGNGKKCYPDKLNCDYFEISNIVVWKNNSVCDVISLENNNDNVDTNSLYKKYGADIDIVFNFNGCFEDMPDVKYKNVGWINIDEISMLTDEQKQAIVESNNNIALSDQRSFYNELENELSNNKVLKDYKLTLDI